MDKSSRFKQQLQADLKQKKIPERIYSLLLEFYESYGLSLDGDLQTLEKYEALFLTFLELIKKQLKNPYNFEHCHKMIRKPFDYHGFGLDFLRPLVDKSKSSVRGKQNIEQVINHLKKKHNVIFLANHQIEADPQAIALLLEDDFEPLAEEMIFVAGERVITDPLAIPFSLGCNLLCIYSKRYIDHPPEEKYQKQLHNKQTMQLMSSLLSEGGKCIYVAPSGGRDRLNKQGNIEIAPFDPASIAMVYLMAKKAKQPTFFYPMTLSTYHLLPPPETIQVELGEVRSAKRVGIHLSVGPSINMEGFPGFDHPDKLVRRKSRADYIWNLVNQNYQKFPKEL